VDIILKNNLIVF